MKQRSCTLNVYFPPQTIKPGYRLGGNQVVKRRCMAEIQNILNTSL